MITGIDHIVLTASDLAKTVWFYRDVLGMELQRFAPPDGSPERLALRFGNQKINLHDAASPYVPHAGRPLAGALDICLLSDLPVDEWCVRLAEQDVHVEQGPVRRTGATGPLLSIYLRDPDENLIEISNVIGS